MNRHANPARLPKSCWRRASAPTDRVLRVLSCGPEWGGAESGHEENPFQ